MISTATTTIAPCTQPRPAPDPPPSVCDTGEVFVSSLLVARRVLNVHQTHVCPAWLAASAYVSGDVGWEYE